MAHQAYAPLGQGKANEMFAEEAVREIAKSHGKTPAQVVLRFLIQSGVAVIPKSVHEERIRENFSLFDLTLTDAEMEQLRTLDTKKAMIGNASDPDLTEFAMTW